MEICMLELNLFFNLSKSTLIALREIKGFVLIFGPDQIV